MVVVIGKRAATGDDDGEWDSNSANVDLAVITQSVAVPRGMTERIARARAN